MRIAIGLGFITATALLAAILCGVLPHPQEATLKARKQVCENIAMSMSLHARDFEFGRMKTLLKSAVEHNEDILSAAVRVTDGRRVVEVGEHSGYWREGLDGSDLKEQVIIPIVTGTDQPWGRIEIRHRALDQPGLAGLLQNSMVRLFLFVPAFSLLIFYIYLRKMLQHLDPSKAVPQHVRSALDALTGGLVVIDKRGRIAFANQVFAAWVGKDPHQLMGKSVSKLPWIATDIATAEGYPWTQAMELKTPQVGVVLKLPMGKLKERALVVNASPVLGNKGDYGGVLTTFEDVTELETNRVELSKAKDAAEQANREKSDFLARMSHEIRTPMNAILGYADVLRRGMDKTLCERQTYVDTIHNSGEHLLSLINDILDLSKIESGKMDLELTPCSPHRLLSQVVSVLKVKTDEKQISLDYQWDGPAPETIITDQVRFRQCVMNLVGNAIKFTEQGGVRIVARLLQDMDEPRLAVDVIDTGVGISPEALEKVFEPFAQADTSVTRRFGGTGLGLAICVQLTEAMNGHVTAKSQVGKGSMFTMTVATGPLDGVTIGEVDSLPQERFEDAPAELSLPPCRVLAVDDNEVNRNLIKLILTRAGAQVETAENGQIAVDMVTSSTFDVVLMDMQMPVLDGYAATRKLRELGMSLPIIALTAHAMRGDEAKCRSAGCSGFLTKPLQMDLVIETITQLMEPHQTTPPTADGEIERMESALREITEISSAVRAHGDSPEQCPTPQQDIEPPVGSDGRDGATEPPIESLLPTEDPEFREIVEMFIERLAEQLDEMRESFEQRDFDRLRRLAHTVKGSGGTAGFPALTEPAAELERLAKAEQMEGIETIIETLAQDSREDEDTREQSLMSPAQRRFTSDHLV